MKLQIFFALIAIVVYNKNVSSQNECENGSARLIADRNSFDMFMQICHNGMWTYLCSDNQSSWSKVMSVVCRQLGYELTQDLANETILERQCPQPDSINNYLEINQQHTVVPGCKIVQDCATIVEATTCKMCVISRCSFGTNAGCGTKRLRLIPGDTAEGQEGRVEVCVGNRWGTVCNNNNALINSVCSSLDQSYPFGAAIAINPPTNQRLSHDCQVIDSSMIDCRDAECNDLLAVRCINRKSILENNMYCLSTQTGQWRNTSTGQMQVCDQGVWVPVDENENICSTQATTAVTPAMKATIREAPRDSSGQLNAPLGAVIGLLFVVLLLTVLGWCITCVILWRKLNLKSKHSPITKPNGSYPMQGLSKDDGGYSSLGPNYTPDEGQYDVVDHKQQQLGHYNVLDRSGGASVAVMESCDPSDGQYDTVDQKPGPPPTKTQDPQPNKEEEFYNAEDHTYSVVVKNKKKPQTK